MLEAFGNIWDHIDDYDAVVITTNGYVKKNGEAVMGKGIALEARNRYPLLAQDLGDMLTKHGNNVFGFCYDENLWIITLPVKPEYGPNGEVGWRAKASIKLIEQSVWQLAGQHPFYGLLRNLGDAGLNLEKIIMPRPGCGNGGLKWEDVKPVIEPYLDDRFTVMEKL
jgi:hypothetical protein